MNNDLDDLSEFAPVGDPEDGGIAFSPVDRRDGQTFAEYAQTYFEYFNAAVERDNRHQTRDYELLVAMAIRYSVQTLGKYADDLEWKYSALTHPMAAEHDLEGTDHRLHYRPSKLTGDYELALERYCRLHQTTDWFTVTSLAELGGLLAGKDADR